MQITIHTFAVLREHFSPELTLSVEKSSTVKDIALQLKQLNPAAGAVIDRCRIAVREAIVTDNLKIEQDEHLYFIPPSSGG